MVVLNAIVVVADIAAAAKETVVVIKLYVYG